MQQYVYMGIWSQVRLFYRVEDRSLYFETSRKMARNISRLPYATVFWAAVLQIVLKKYDVPYVPSNMGIYVCCSMLIGLMAGYFFTRRVKKNEQNALMYLKPLGYMGETELKQILRTARKTSRLQFWGKVMMVMVVIGEPFYIKNVPSLYFTLLYPLCWAFAGYVFMYINLKERRRAIKEFKQQYNL